MSRRRNIRTQTDQELAELEAAEQADQEQPLEKITPAALRASAPTPIDTPPPGRLAALPASPLRKQTRHMEEEEEDEESDPSFEETYRRETYYIRRTNRPRLKRLLKKLKPRNKYELMEEGLEYLFEKYEIE